MATFQAFFPNVSKTSGNPVDLSNLVTLYISGILPSRVNGHIGFDVSGDLGTVHVRGVLKVSRETMVLADEGIENISEVDVRIFISGVHTAMLVIELNGTGNGLGQGEARGLGSDAGKLVPFLLGDVLGDQRVLGLDFRECGHGAGKSNFV